MSYHLLSKTTANQTDRIMTSIQNKGAIISKLSKKDLLDEHDKVPWIASQSLAASMVGKARFQGGQRTSKNNFVV